MNQFVLILKIVAFVIITIDSIEIRCGGGKYRETMIKIDHLKKHLDSYKQDMGYYPNDLESLLFEDKTKWNGPYISSRKLTDAWKNKYDYKSFNYKQYKIVSYGQDGKSGGVGLSTDIIFLNTKVSSI